ncbi:MAG: hypothetical protein QG656_613 [Candidatus Hydrogenedentes bacterium]|nr:hypothetical protein [Candidatus Hydrogenedentota bacterium]
MSGLRVNLLDLVFPLARAIDRMNPAVAAHHMQVAYLSLRLAEELGFPPAETGQIAVAGALHDIGAFTLKGRLDLLEFEDARPGHHSIAGALFLRQFEPFHAIADMVRFHHQPWRDGAGAAVAGLPVPRGSHVLHLADRVAVLLPKNGHVLGGVGKIVRAIEAKSGGVFVPEFVEALKRLAKRDYIWLAATSNAIESILQRNVSLGGQELDLDGLLDFARLFMRVIDFKSPFTVTHSSGVAASAVAMARLEGFTAEDCTMMEVAGYLHDLGKIAIPAELIEKPARLTDDEYHVMRSHVYYTHEILGPVDALREITSWGALHQERLDGSGYPFGLTGAQLPLGARLMAVADVFTALAEDRPYRKGMPKPEAMDVLSDMARAGKLDSVLVQSLERHYEAIDAARAQAQDRARREYAEFTASIA